MAEFNFLGADFDINSFLNQRFNQFYNVSDNNNQLGQINYGRPPTVSIKKIIFRYIFDTLFHLYTFNYRLISFMKVIIINNNSILTLTPL